MLPAFAAVGLELEYAIVDRTTLDVRPIAERLLAALAGGPACDVRRGDIGWSNELVAHVVELKNPAPVARLQPAAAAFQRAVREVNAVLAKDDAALMPGGMHPWMDPRTETRLWSGEGAPIYDAFDRIFGCRRHGWANLQSMHVNLPFADDAEFARLHAALRVLLPLVPGLSASSPVADSTLQPELDHRLEVYRTHADAVPQVVGRMIPEQVRSRADYEASILAPMYRSVGPLDPGGVLQHEWLNARAAIARFDRNAIEIRLCDTQECPRADVAIAAAVTAAARALFEARWSSPAEQDAVTDDTLYALLRASIRDADRAALPDDLAYRAALGLTRDDRTVGDAWTRLTARCTADIAALDPDAAEPLGLILTQGPLARRLCAALGSCTSREVLRDVYRRLCACLDTGTLFTPA